MSESAPLRTAADVRREFEYYGVSISEWARKHHFATGLVYQVLAGKKKCLRGQSHQIAVRLGMKAGQIGTIEDLNAILKAMNPPGGAA